MLPQHQQNTNLGVGWGIVTQFIGFMVIGISPSDSDLEVLGGLILLSGMGLFFWGCWSYSRGKGYSGCLGILGAGFSIFGLVFLVLLPDKHPMN